jgi:hypothetical protein
MKVSAVAMPVVVPPNVKEVAVSTFPTAGELGINVAGVETVEVATKVTAAVRVAKFAIWFAPAGVESPESHLRAQAVFFARSAPPDIVITTDAVAVPLFVMVLVPATLVAQLASIAQAWVPEPVKLGRTSVILSVCLIAA